MLFVGMICVPKQMVVLKDTSSSANEVEEAGLKFPLGIRSKVSF